MRADVLLLNLECEGWQVDTDSGVSGLACCYSPRDPEALEGHVRPVAGIAWNPNGEQSVMIMFPEYPS